MRALDQVREGVEAVFTGERPNKLESLGKTAKAAAGELSLASAEQKTKALHAAAAAILEASEDICAANAQDMIAGKEKGLSKAMLDRLFLDEDRVEAMAQAVPI